MDLHFMNLTFMRYLLVQWLDFGAFSSYAPASDSNNANATYESTYMGRHAKRFKKWDKNQLNNVGKETDNMETDDSEINASWLAKEGLDIEVIEAAMNEAPKNVDEKLEQNSELLEELLGYQKTRFEGGESHWTAVNEKEVEIGIHFILNSSCF